MINKRLLVKNLLAHNDENSFYDKKLRLNIGEKEGKAKFLKHICALANSNPANNAFLVVGIEDTDNEIVGVDFFDDSKIQNLVNAYLANPPLVSYENISFPHLTNDKVVGLVTIKAQNGMLCSLRKNIWKYYGGSVFFRDGSISMPKIFESTIKDVNSGKVAEIEAHSQNSIKLTLDGVFDFFKSRSHVKPKYNVFKDYFIVCWAGAEKRVGNDRYYSRVDIALINEQVKLFYSALDEVRISISKDSFTIVEYVQLGLQQQQFYYPLEEVCIKFKDNVSYDISSKILFKPPVFNNKSLHHLYNHHTALLKKLQNHIPLTSSDKEDLKQLPSTYLMCYLNDFSDALYQLELSKPYLKALDSELYLLYKQTIRIIRKLRYN